MPKPSELKGGWNTDVSLIPDFTEKELYNYLILSNTRTFDFAPLGAHKQLKARVMYEDNHVYDIKYHPVSEQCTHCFVKCRHIPSLPTTDKKNQPDHYVWVSLSKVTGHVHSADCSCVAG